LFSACGEPITPPTVAASPQSTTSSVALAHIGEGLAPNLLNASIADLSKRRAKNETQSAHPTHESLMDVAEDPKSGNYHG